MSVGPRGPISFEPPSLDVNLYAGDGAVFVVEVYRDANTPLALDGELDAQIRRTRIADEVLLHWTIDDTDAQDGIARLSLTGEETDSLLRPTDLRMEASWDLQWSRPAAQPVTLLQGRVRCARDVTRPLFDEPDLNGGGP